MSCLLCAGTNYTTVYHPPAVGERALCHCVGCGLVQMVPLPTTVELSAYYQHYDVLGEREPYYAALWGPDALGTAEGRDIGERFEWMQTHRSLPARVLDVGSGPGLFLRLVNEVGGTAEGVELNAAAAERSSRETGAVVYRGTIAEVPEREYDAITLWDLLEHDNNPSVLISHIRDKLTPGGWLFIETPNEAALLDRVVLFLARIGIRGPANTFYGMHHLVLFRPATVRRLLEENGFRIIEIRPAETAVSRIYRGTSFTDRIMRLGLGALFIVARLLKKQNKMLIAAQKRTTDY